MYALWFRKHRWSGYENAIGRSCVLVLQAGLGQAAKRRSMLFISALGAAVDGESRGLELQQLSCIVDVTDLGNCAPQRHHLLLDRDIQSS